MNLAFSVYPFATQDLRVDSSVFLDFCMKLDSPKVTKVTKPVFEKKSPRGRRAQKVPKIAQK